MPKKTTNVNVADDKHLQKLVREYWALKNKEAITAQQIARVKGNIFNHFGIEQEKKLTKKAADAFVKLTLRLGDKAKSVVSIFVNSRTTPNWKYIEDKLGPKQMQYAKKSSRNVELRITKKD